MPHVKTCLKFQTIDEECHMSIPKEEKITSILGLEKGFKFGSGYGA